MGEKSSEKRDRQIKESVDKALAMFSSLEKSNSLAPMIAEPVTTPLRWMAKVGAVAIFFGVFGMFSLFFWPSVTAIYLGCVLLLLDLWNENWGAYGWFRWVFTALAIVGLYFFTTKIVTHDDAISFNYKGYMNLDSNNEGILNVFVTNETEQDYKDLDFYVVLPDFDYVIGAKQISALASCSLFPIKQAAGIKGRHYRKWWTDAMPESPSYLGDFQRIRCETLPHKAVLQVALEVRHGEDLTLPSGKPSIGIKGDYIGKFRKFDTPAEAAFETQTETNVEVQRSP